MYKLLSVGQLFLTRRAKFRSPHIVIGPRKSPSMHPQRLFCSNNKKKGIEEQSPYRVEEISKLSARLDKFHISFQANKSIISNLEKKLQDVPSKSETEAIIDSLIKASTNPLKKLLETDVSSLNSRTTKTEEDLIKFNQFVAGLSNTFSSFEDKIVQTKVDRQLDYSSQPESEIIRAAKIQAEATNHQSWILLVALLVAFTALLLDYVYHKALKKDMRLLEQKEEANQKEIIGLSEDNDAFTKENKKLNSLIVSLTDDMNSLKNEDQRLKYIEQNSCFFWKREPKSPTNEPGVANSDIITPSIRK